MKEYFIPNLPELKANKRYDWYWTVNVTFCIIYCFLLH
jgi:hypothetical protein